MRCVLTLGRRFSETAYSSIAQTIFRQAASGGVIQSAPSARHPDRLKNGRWHTESFATCLSSCDSLTNPLFFTKVGAATDTLYRLA